MKSNRKDSSKENRADFLDEFQSCFFSTSRLASFPWTFLENDLESSKSSQLILDVLKQTCLHALCKKFPPSVRYRKLFLVELIRRVEAADCEPLDELYDSLAEVVSAQEAAEGYRTFLLVPHTHTHILGDIIESAHVEFVLQPCGGTVSLLENLALISEGTTGLVTWEAAHYLAEWALDHPQTFAGRKVLELGSGVGFTGVTVCRSCGPSKYVFSDGHSSVLQRLEDNVRLNGLLQEETPPEVSVEKLDWSDVTEERLDAIGADVVIAADVAYDPDVVAVLVQLLSRILRRKCGRVLPEVFICSTVRNRQTYDGFTKQLGDAGISHRVISGAVSHVFQYKRVSEVELIKLYV
ncbi:protein-lysine N-methyltransferase EEF2KMT isoform X1 [Dunckerocampus dactyliophorus]|uniref:protein-lysine N-methyltransferase EEF2KMT isoform X1 n=1 Tax=Dunckerocampus dactyliophorus TaxID=161453 RepID=UPI002404FA2A|nr:protein-lysine N-methyltransferase EEF2KMT isoform X1 [Dunckerocampus dactyliophorus]